MKLFTNKYFILGNVFLVLIALPLTLFFLRKQQELRGRAAPTTKLSFFPDSVKAGPGQEFSVDAMVNPTQNVVSIVDMHVTFDSQKLEIVSIKPNDIAFPVTLRGPTYETGKANISVNIGAEVTKAISTQTKVATLTFKVKPEGTKGNTNVAYNAEKARVFSLSTDDQPGENVLASTSPLTVTVQDVAITPTPSVSPTVTPAGPTPTPSNRAPVCTGLATNQGTTGAAPFIVVFTVNGNDVDGVINKASFNFGDGVTQDMTVGGGIGTNAVSVQVNHTYNTAGNYQASAVLTDDKAAISASCLLTITVQSQAVASPTKTPTIAPPGSTTTTLGIIGAVVITIIGGAVLLFL